MLIVKVRVDVPPEMIGLGANNLEMLGGIKTVREEVAIPVGPIFVPPCVEETNSLILS